MVMEMCQAGSLVDIYTATKGMKEEHISYVLGEMLKVGQSLSLTHSLLCLPPSLL